MGDRSISASERQRQLADKADRDRIEGTVLNEIRKVPIIVDGAVAAHAGEADPHPQYAKDTDLAAYAPLASPAFTGTPTAPTAPVGTNTTQIATMAALQTAIANLVASSPATLDTLNELATALGNDPNFATTITTALAGKQPLDATLTALAAADWAANALPIGTGANALAQTAFAANTFPARASTGNLVAKAITDAALSGLSVWAAGSFTPTVEGSTTAGAGTYTTQSGRYTRIGDVVHFRLTVTITAHTGTGNLRIAGLPVAALAGFNAPVAVGQCDNLTTPASTQLVAEVLAGTPQIRVLTIPSGGGVSAGLALDTAFTLTLAGSYHV